MNVSQASASRASYLEAYSRDSAALAKKTAAGNRSKSDTVSFSSEAMQLAQNMGSVNGGIANAETEPAIERAPFILTMKDERKLDIAALFGKFAEAKPEKYKEMLQAMSSGDTEDFIQAFAYVTGEKADDIREVLKDMPPEDIGRLAKQLNDLGVQPSSSFFHGMSKVTELDIDELMQWYHRA